MQKILIILNITDENELAKKLEITIITIKIKHLYPGIIFCIVMKYKIQI